ncbi:MAG: hypothetical protein INR69_12555 [Mucilaginibacter polytrichastri]|nr:hypothetical protein [Mucilaginibacter polytrichastri]
MENYPQPGAKFSALSRKLSGLATSRRSFGEVYALLLEEFAAQGGEDVNRHPFSYHSGLKQLIHGHALDYEDAVAENLPEPELDKKYARFTERFRALVDRQLNTLKNEDGEAEFARYNREVPKNYLLVDADLAHDPEQFEGFRTGQTVRLKADPARFFLILKTPRTSGNERFLLVHGAEEMQASPEEIMHADPDDFTDRMITINY